jgi:hypothetical protein
LLNSEGIGGFSFETGGSVFGAPGDVRWILGGAGLEVKAAATAAG